MADLIIRIAGNASELQKEFDKVSKLTEDLRDQLQSVAKASAAAFASTSAAIGFSLKQFGDAQKITQQTNAILKATGGIAGVSAEQVEELGQAMAQLTAFSDEAVKEAENVLLTFTQIGEETFPQATKATLDLATALDTDATSAARVLGRALQDPEQGLTALRRANIIFTDAQQATIKQMIAMNDTAGAQKLILDQLNGTIGGLAQESAKGVSGSFTQLRNVFEDISEELGARFAPAAQNILDVLKDGLTVFKENKEAIDLLAKAFIAAFVTSGIVASVSALGVALTYLPTALVAANAALTALGSTGGVFSLALVGMAGALALFMNRLDAARQKAIDAELRSSGADKARANPALEEMVKEAERQKGLQRQKAIDEQEAALRAAKLNNERIVLEATLLELRGYGDERIEISKQIAENELAIQTETDVRKKEIRTQLAEEYNQLLVEELEREGQARVEFQEFLVDLEEQTNLERIDRASRTYQQLEAEARKHYQTEEQLRKNFITKEFQEAQQRRQQHFNDEQKFGKLQADFNELMRDEQFQRTRKGFDELAAMTKSKNETLKAIGKAAAVANIAIRTAEGAVTAFNAAQFLGPFIGPVVGAALAAAVVAFGAEQTAQVLAAQTGGIVTGGIAGQDSVSALLTPGELIVPQHNFEEVVNAVASARLAEQGSVVSTSTGGEQRVLVEIAFAGNASQILTARQIEDRRLGISRET